MKHLAYLVVLFVLVGAIRISDVPTAAESDFPEATIRNGVIEARLLLPDSKKGYYRGSRFDWAGVIADLKYKDHTYFGQWNDQYSPTLHDAIMGPVDAFDPIAFADAKPGESFLKIGIGTLKKPDDKPYHFATPYEILDGGNWRVSKKKDQVEFVHQHAWSGYGYTYKKIVRLEPGKPQLTLVHTLKNTGASPLETNVYNHNFFVIDRQTTGPDFRVSFAFPLSGENKSPADIGELQGNEVVYKRPLEKGETLLFVPVTGFGDSAKDNVVTIENLKTGAGVKVSCDLPITRLVYWSSSTTVCPEPYSKILVNPGQELTWSNVYEFFVLSERK